MPKKLSNEEFLQRFNNEKDSSDYDICSKYITSASPITLRHKICGHIFDVKPNNFFVRKTRCPKCSGRKKLTVEEVRERINQLDSDYSLVTRTYKNNKAKLTLLHKKCNNEFKMSFHDFDSGNRCSICCKSRKLTVEEKNERFLNSFKSEEYTIIDTHDFTVNEKISVLHKVCNSTFKTTFKRFTGKREFGLSNRCPICDREKRLSTGEIKIRETLIKMGVDFIEQVSIDNFRNRRKLTFDFEIFRRDGSSFLLEYDGVSHFKPCFGGTREKRETVLFNQIQRDSLKNKFCEEEGIELARIDYKQFGRIKELIKTLIEN